jgi:hypothetical protein
MARSAVLITDFEVAVRKRGCRRIRPPPIAGDGVWLFTSIIQRISVFGGTLIDLAACLIFGRRHPLLKQRRTRSSSS